MKFLISFYKKTIQQYSIVLLLFYLLLSVFFGYHAVDFRLDASPDSLHLENDKDLEYYRLIKDQYGSDEYLIVTYSPLFGSLFSDKSLADLRKVVNELLVINQVESVTSILDAPLLSNPNLTLSNILNNVKTIEDGDVDKVLAKKELVTSPLYENSLISSKGDIAAILIKFHNDKVYDDLLQKRNYLHQKRQKNNLSESEKESLALVSQQFDLHKTEVLEDQANNIVLVRQVIAKFHNEYNMFIGGIPMIVADSIDFIKNDIKVFGVGVLVFVILTLLIIFRSFSWVISSLLVCFVTVLIVIGLLAMIGWPVTLVSSNFISLLLIITLSMSIHLFVSYREVCLKDPAINRDAAVFSAVKHVIIPCAYTVITTIIAFCSLAMSNIRPIIDFGYIMVIGVLIAFFVVFTLLPNLLPKVNISEKAKNEDKFCNYITQFFANLVCQRGLLIFLTFLSFMIIGIVGISKLTVENSFINYYKESTDINRGMRVIDNELGGTMPLDIIIDAPKSEDFESAEEFEDDLWMQNDAVSEDKKDCSFSGGYWFNSYNLQAAVRIHDYLDSLPQIGNVISIATSAKILQSLNQGKPIDTFFLNLSCQKISEEIKKILFNPYISQDGNQLHFDVRIIESSDSLKRDKLIKDIKSHLINEFNFKENDIHLNGMLVLYNNILKSLFDSQILTLAFVFLAIFTMFLLLFRNFMASIIAIIPNAMVAVFSLGIMGWFNIALDIMTITIAAISIGIAVDDTIHYIYRFKEEFKKDQNYNLAIKRSHRTIGKAMYYTSVTIAFGFSVLVFSNFVPTIYFGILTASSMITALLLDFMLLPLLILWFKPFSCKERDILQG